MLVLGYVNNFSLAQLLNDSGAVVGQLGWQFRAKFAANNFCMNCWSKNDGSSLRS